MIGSSPLFSMVRGDSAEVTVHGEIVVTFEEQILFQTSDVVGKFPARSLLKPFQFLATGLAVGELPLWHTAALGSISASQHQFDQLRQWYAGDRARFFERNKVPPMFPMEERHRVLLKEAGQGPGQWFHTCLSKHAAILECCEQNGWTSEDYQSVGHPYFHALETYLIAHLGGKNRTTVTDGCGLPSPLFTSTELAKLFEKLIGAPKGSSEGFVASAMMKNPEWIGGPKRVDTRLMQKNSGRLIAKEGADGLLGIGAMASKTVSGPVGILVKIAAGFYPELAAMAVAPVLSALGLQTSCEIPNGQKIQYHFEAFHTAGPKLQDVSPLIHEGIAVWPQDVPFSRTLSVDTNAGSHLTISSINTTLHLGTHTDSPNHFLEKSIGIDQADLSKYLGPCQVISVTTKRGQKIAVSDLNGVEIRAQRILFRTCSFPNPNFFNTDFVALSSDVIEYLALQNVKLVGIDTPSVDLFDSKDLLAHKATQKQKMGILEGLVLEPILDGFYEMFALPLKLQNADASPVRVALKELR